LQNKFVDDVRLFDIEMARRITI